MSAAMAAMDSPGVSKRGGDMFGESVGESVGVLPSGGVHDVSMGDDMIVCVFHMANIKINENERKKNVFLQIDDKTKQK